MNQENTARVVALAIAFFGGLAALGHWSGVFERLGSELVYSLAAFGLAFALLTYHLDAGVRAFVKRLASFGRRKARERRAAEPAGV